MAGTRLKVKFGGSVKALFTAGVFLLGFPGLSTQAATVTAFSNDLAGWNTAVAGLGPVLTEDFADTTLIPELSITFGSGPPIGECLSCALPGSISGGEYHDRANDLQATQPLLTFNGPGAFAFGADWDLGPNSPGTGIELFVTFTDLSTAVVATQILNPFVNQFFGIVSDMPILSILLREGDQIPGIYETFDMDNAQLVAVPIPAALPLFLSAIAGLAFVARRRKRVLAD